VGRTGAGRTTPLDGQVDRMTPGGQSQHESRPRDGTADIYPASQSQTSYNQYSQLQTGFGIDVRYAAPLCLVAVDVSGVGPAVRGEPVRRQAPDPAEFGGGEHPRAAGAQTLGSLDPEYLEPPNRQKGPCAALGAD